MIWNTKVTVQQLNQSTNNTLIASLGIEIVEIGNNFITARMPVDMRTIQPHGSLHGGASVALAETLGSVASTLLLTDMNKQFIVGIGVNANHLKGVTSGWVMAKAIPVNIGKKIHVWQIDIVNETDEIVCKAILTTMVINKS